MTLGSWWGHREPILGPFAAPRPFSAHISPNSLALKGTSHHCSLRSRALGPLGHCGMRDLRFDVLGTCRAVESQSTPFAAPRPFSAHISPNSLFLKGTSHHCSLLSCSFGPLRHGRAKISHHEVLQGPYRASGRAPDLPGLHESGEPHSVRPEGPISTLAASRSRSGPYGNVR